MLVVWNTFFHEKENREKKSRLILCDFSLVPTLGVAFSVSFAK